MPAESFGAALQYFTGSKEHNVVLRGPGQEPRAEDQRIRRLSGRRPRERYLCRPDRGRSLRALDCRFPPEIREARFEFAWAAAGPLPRLVEVDDMRGDLHMHTTATDGRATLEEMVAAARHRGLAYIAITDHSKRVSMANGLDERGAGTMGPDRRLNATLTGLRVLKGVEVDILERGGLDLPTMCLAEADWVVASVHYGQKQPREQITAASSAPWKTRTSRRSPIPRAG